jgi:hypothetical protein
LLGGKSRRLGADCHASGEHTGYSDKTRATIHGHKRTSTRQDC